MAKLKTVIAGVIGACALAGGLGQAQASTMTFHNVNDTSTILFSNTFQNATLLTTVKFTLSTVSATSATFAVVVNNGSSGDGTNRFMSFGVDVVSPTLTGASAGSPWAAGINQNLPSFQQMDLCVWDSNGCTGGNINNGIGELDTSSFNLTLTTAGNFTAAAGIGFTSPYAAKYQDSGTNGKSIEFAGCIQGSTDGSCDTINPPIEIPEPSSLALVGLSLLGLAAAARRRQA